MVKRAGIMILLAFSIPLATPIPMIRKEPTQATISQKLLPKEVAVVSNKLAILGRSCPMAERLPVKAR